VGNDLDTTGQPWSSLPYLIALHPVCSEVADIGIVIGCGSTAEVSYQSKSGPDSLSASNPFVGTAFAVDAVIS
jgi:hypothetical protein